MRLLRVLPFLLVVAPPLAAQLTPEQRVERENKELSLNYNRFLADQLERRALAGDPTAYAGPAGCGGREAAPGCGWRYGYAPWRSPAAEANLWMSISDGPQTPRRLRRGEATFRVKAEAHNVVTLAAPIGATGKSLMVRTVVEGNGDAPTWTSMREVTGDDQERYLVPLPTLDAGEYTVKIEVYDPDSPMAPYSTSSSKLKIS